MSADPPREPFLGTIERLAMQLLPEPLRKFRVTASPVRREYRYEDAEGFCVVVELTSSGVNVGIGLRGTVGEKVHGNLQTSRELLEQTLGKGLLFGGEIEDRWIGETIPLTDPDRRMADVVSRRFATYILYFKPMIDDLGSRA